jgi:hypothetical protein
MGNGVRDVPAMRWQVPEEFRGRRKESPGAWADTEFGRFEQMAMPDGTNLAIFTPPDGLTEVLSLPNRRGSYGACLETFQEMYRQAHPKGPPVLRLVPMISRPWSIRSGDS